MRFIPMPCPISCLLLASLSMPALWAQAPLFQGGRLAGSPSVSSARENWVRITNRQFEMSGKTLRVVQEGEDGLTVVVLASGVEKLRHAKPILLGKDEHQMLFRSIVAEGFNRIVVRNPENGKQWAARLEQGKAIIED